jgi:hypothetical protein
MNIFLALLAIVISNPDAHRPQPRKEVLTSVQYNQSSAIVGLWISGNFAFEFYPDGTYGYAGTIGNETMQTQLSEAGTYDFSGQTLTLDRARGFIKNNMNYRQELRPQRTVYNCTLVNTQRGPGLQVVLPAGAQVFYKQ